MAPARALFGFGGSLGGKDKGGKKAAEEVERSSLVNEETVYFIFQLDLDVQLQRCLNYEAYEQAQEVRAKRTKVDEAVEQMRARKGKNAGVPEGAATLSVADFASEGLRLRTEMQRAVEEERYKDAAKLRDLLADLERESKKAQAMADEWSGAAGPGPRFRLGQRVSHKAHGFRGVIVGWDAQCCESEEWMEQAGTGELARGTGQRFYHLLVDTRDWENDVSQPPVAYVAEELLGAPELDSDPPASWLEAHGPEPLQHPYLYILFLGQDSRGDYVPCRQLRDKYNARRRDVWAPGKEPGAEGGGEGDAPEPGADRNN